MKNGKSSLTIYVAVTLLLLTVHNVIAETGEVESNAGLYKVSCDCSCNGETISAFGISNDEATVSDKCDENCARSCGSQTGCSDSSACTTCCETDCASFSDDAGDACEKACRSACSFKGSISDITNIVYAVAGIIGVIMIVMHGIRIITADDPSDRKSAKNSIIYVLVGLAIIALAGIAVNMFIN